jgi:hypothetical protein
MSNCLFSKLEAAAAQRGIGLWSWLAVATATMMTINSQDSTTTLFDHVAASKPLHQQIVIAEFMREIGLRCTAVVGVWHTIHPGSSADSCDRYQEPLMS